MFRKIKEKIKKLFTKKKIEKIYYEKDFINYLDLTMNLLKNWNEIDATKAIKASYDNNNIKIEITIKLEKKSS